MDLQLPYNYDGSSCFIHSLFCALFYPVKLQVFDNYLLRGARVDLRNSDIKDLAEVLKVTATCIRGLALGKASIYNEVRSLSSFYLQKVTGIDFSRGQCDPTDLYEALMRTFRVGGVFLTKKTIKSKYRNGRMTETVSTDQMFRFSVFHSVTAGHTTFETLFPFVDSLTITPSEQNEDALVHQKTIIEFAGGPVLCFTREHTVLGTTTDTVNYGRFSPSTNAFLLPLVNTVKKTVDWYELQAVLCWNGYRSMAGEQGHYTAFLFNENMSTWMFYDCGQATDNGTTVLEPIQHPELHSSYAPSKTGCMFFYSSVSDVPSDV